MVVRSDVMSFQVAEKIPLTYKPSVAVCAGMRLHSHVGENMLPQFTGSLINPATSSKVTNVATLLWRPAWERCRGGQGRGVGRERRGSDGKRRGV